MSDPVMFDAVIGRLVRQRDARGFVTNEEARAAATLLGLSERTVWRQLQRGGAHKRKARYELGDPEIVVLYACAGNASETWRTLRRSGHWSEGGQPTLRTFQRAVDERVSGQVVAGARGGRTGHDQCNPTIARVTTHRNEMWATDHKKLPLRVRDANGEPSEVWFTELQDQHTRMVMGFTLTLTDATLEDDKELLAIAVEGAEHATDAGVVFVGGVPHTLHSDRGGDYISWGASVGLVETGIERSFTMPYSPNANGRVESFHGWLEKSVCPQIPGYVHQRYQHKRPDAAAPSTDIENLQTVEQLSVIIGQRMAEFNFERVHSTLGTTPFEAWCTDTHPIQEGDPAAIRAAMRQQGIRTVDRGRIRFRNLIYTCTELVEVAGRKVAFRYLNSDTQYIDVDLGAGRWVRAWDVQRMPDAEQVRILSARGPRAAAFNTRMKLADIARADLSRLAFAAAEAEHSPEDLLAARIALMGTPEPGPAPTRRAETRRTRAAVNAQRATDDAADEFELPTPRLLQGRTHAS